ncbi:MAG: N-acetyl-gamma-glutamyl-phosphate reductase [Candidatus Omnitrophota bacterium]
MVKVGVVGATGYTGEELVEVLLKNPDVEITSLSAIVDKEKPFSNMYPRFGKKISVVCGNLDVEKVSESADIVFLALPHTVSMKFAPLFLSKGKRVIDLSADYRLPEKTYKKWYATEHSDAANLEKAVYGLPELNRNSIRTARLIANPGCYPTSVILALMPIAGAIAESGLDVIADSKSGATGAGRKAAIALSFGEIDSNFKCYKANAHQHMPEMEHILSGSSGKEFKLNFTPHLVPMRRGILSTIYVKHKGLPDAESIHKLYGDKYENEPFVRVRPLGELPEIKDVSGTNFCDIGLTSAGGMLVIVSVIDNLLKGASGQAMQNMNIMCGLDEGQGLV